MSRPALVVLAVAALTALLATIAPELADPARDPGPSFALGVLLLLGLAAGSVTHALRGPRLTGYLLAGILVGPSALGWIGEDALEPLGVINHVTVALIAISAGAELKLATLRRRRRLMLSVALVQVATVLAAVVLLLLALRPGLAFLAGRLPAEALLVALVCASVAISNSPLVAMAVIDETRARGPVADTVLSVAVLVDIAVVLLFSISLGIAEPLLGGGPRPAPASLALHLVQHVGGSLAAGLLLGIGVTAYVHHVRAELPLFTVGLAVLIGHGGPLLGLEPLLVGLGCGFFAENVSRVDTEPLLAGISRASVPIYVAFFALAGASLHLDALARMWPHALALIAARGVAILLSVRLGARLAAAEPAVARYAWSGFLSQAGVSLGLATVLSDAFPGWGADATTLLVAMITLHELAGPVAFRWGLTRAGEAGRAEAPASAAPDPAAAAPDGGGTARGLAPPAPTRARALARRLTTTGGFP